MKGHSLVKPIIILSTLFLVNTSQAAYTSYFSPGWLSLPSPWVPQLTVGGAPAFTNDTIHNSDDIPKIVFANVLMPILANDSSLWYLDGHQYMTSQCCFYDSSLGGGYRQIIGNSYILGGYGFWDFTRTPDSNNFYQLSAGAELLSPTWKGHVSAYVPYGNKSQSTPNSSPEGVQQGPFLPQAITIIEYPYQEESKGGGDIQVGRTLDFLSPSLLPFVGYYHFGFNNDTTINGGRVGLQYTHNRWLTLFATDQYDNLNKNYVILGASVTLGTTQSPTNSILDDLMETSPFGPSGIF